MITAARLFSQHHMPTLLCVGYATGPGPALLMQGLAEPGCSKAQNPHFQCKCILCQFIVTVIQRFIVTYVTFFLLLYLQKPVPSLQLHHIEHPTWSLLCYSLFLSSSEFCFGFLLPKDRWWELAATFQTELSSSLYGGSSASPSLLEISCLINPMISLGFCVEF